MTLPNRVLKGFPHFEVGKKSGTFVPYLNISTNVYRDADPETPGFVCNITEATKML